MSLGGINREGYRMLPAGVEQPESRITRTMQAACSRGAATDGSQGWSAAQPLGIGPLPNLVEP